MWRNQQKSSNFNTSGLIQSLVITSDPQYPWTDCTDGASFQDCNITTVSRCQNYSENDSMREQRSEALIREQYNNINSYMNTVPNGSVIINGDVTAFGHEWQWNKMRLTLLPILNKPYYYGLGNHDITNNFNNCADNGCFKNSLNHLQAHIRSHNLPLSQFDYSARPIVTWAGVGERREGSFAYTLDFGNICSIQLQHDPQMDQFAGVTFGNSNEYHIFENRTWIENQLRSARASGKIIIVHVHSNDNLTTYHEKLFEQYGVVAIFSGHIHTSYGNNGFFGNIPKFRSGSASQRTYLILEHFSDRLDIYAVNCNNWENNRQLVRSIPIPEPPKFDGTFQIVTALNNSSVLNYERSNHKVILWSNLENNYQRFNFMYDSSKDAYVIRMASNQNQVLAWNVPSADRHVFVTFGPTGDEHYWIIENFQDGYIFRNKKDPNLVLDVVNSAVGNGTNIIVHNRHPLNTTYRNQTFFIRPV
ncbi:metallophosphoesterase [Bacillus thuringiensis]|uniref:metallophosphoesterase n=1 Tax=Bacillus thuringiensis TaxID=1428 RepID=UPI0033924009